MCNMFQQCGVLGGQGKKTNKTKEHRQYLSKRRYVKLMITERRRVKMFFKKNYILYSDIQSKREKIFNHYPIHSVPDSTFQHLYTTLITYSTFSPGEDQSLDQQDMQRPLHPGNIFKLFRSVYQPSLQNKSMKFCQCIHNIYQSAPEQPNPQPTKRLTHT